MSASIIWSIPAEVIEQAVQNQLGLESPVSVWGAIFDEVGLQLGVIIEIDDSDIGKLGLDDIECHFLDSDELVQ